MGARGWHRLLPLDAHPATELSIGAGVPPERQQGPAVGTGPIAGLLVKQKALKAQAAVGVSDLEPGEGAGCGAALDAKSRLSLGCLHAPGGKKRPQSCGTAPGPGAKSSRALREGHGWAGVWWPSSQGPQQGFMCMQVQTKKKKQTPSSF